MPPPVEFAFTSKEFQTYSGFAVIAATSVGDPGGRLVQMEAFGTLPPPPLPVPNQAAAGSHQARTHFWSVQ